MSSPDSDRPDLDNEGAAEDEEYRSMWDSPRKAVNRAFRLRRDHGSDSAPNPSAEPPADPDSRRSRGEPSDRSGDQYHVYVDNRPHSTGDIDGPAEFYPLGLESLEPFSGLEPPQAVVDLSNRLQTEHLLILGGADFAEKHSLACQVIWNLQTTCRPGPDHGVELAAKEWLRGSDRPRLATLLQTGSKPTIYLLDQARPIHLEFASQRLRELARRNGHFVLITTDFSVDEWSLPEGFSQCVWQNLTTTKIYTPRYLAQCLRQTLKGVEVEGIFPDGPPPNRDEDAVLNAPLIHSLTLLDAATLLQSPDRIRSFADWLRRHSGPLELEQITRFIRRLQGNKAAIEGWYRQLDPRKRLLITFIALFDGLLDDQLFATLDIILDAVWRDRDPSQPAYDYNDLNELSSYVRKNPLDRGGLTLSTNSRSQRQALLEVSWELHRRQILAAIPVVAELVNRASQWLNQSFRHAAAPQITARTSPNAEQRDSAEDNGQDSGMAQPSAVREGYVSRWHDYGPERELYSTVPRKAKLLQALADALSVLGTFSRNAVERALHQIAANREWEVRQVTATAMARWKEHPDHPQLLYATLHAWQNEARQKARGAAPQEDARGLSQIRATVMEIVGYSVLYDPPNQLAEPLLRLIEKALPDHNRLVQTALRFLTIPLAVAHHRRQLDDFIIELVTDSQMIRAVAMGWAKCLELRPEEGKELIREWHRRFLSATANPEEPPERNERCLATLAATYGEIEVGSSAALDSDELLRRIHQLLQNHHPFVRDWAIRALTRRIGVHVKEIPKRLQQVLAELRLEEKPRVVTALRGLYLRQRASLEGGDFKVSIKGTSFVLWSRPGLRPLTTVEVTLYDWFADESQPETQELALAALAEIRATAVDEEERHLQELGPPEVPAESPTQAKEIKTIVRVTDPPRRRFLDRVQKLLLNLTTWQEQRIRTGLSGLTPELIVQDRRDLQRMRPVFDSLRAQGGRTALLGRYLRRFQYLYRWRKLLFAVTGLILLVMLLQMIF